MVPILSGSRVARKSPTGAGPVKGKTGPTIALVKIVKKPATTKRGEIISFEIIASGICQEAEK